MITNISCYPSIVETAVGSKDKPLGSGILNYFGRKCLESKYVCWFFHSEEWNIMVNIVMYSMKYMTDITVSVMQ